MVINSLCLHSEYDLLNLMIIPLMLQDKLNVVENLVRDSHEEQVKLVQFFDKISDRKFDLTTLLPSDGRVSALEVTWQESLSSNWCN